MDSAKNYLDVYEVATYIEQYSLNKECKLLMTLPELKPPYPISATVSFSYDAQQTSFSLIFNEEEDEEDFEDMVEFDISINLPFLEGYNNVAELFEEVINNNPELDPVLVKKEFFRKDSINGEEYEIIYTHVIGGEELRDNQLYDDIFLELSDILRIIYEKNKFFIESTWYKEEEDDTF